MPSARYEPEALIRVLVEHDVQCVIIGGYAAGLLGSPFPTRDVDVTPETSKANLDRLARALRALDARIRVPDVEDGLAFSCDGESLGAVQGWNLTTRHGDLDIAFVPSGTRGYPDLVADAVQVTVDGVPMSLASLADIVRSKQAANRPKDQRVLPTLRELVARQRHERR